MKKTCLVFFIVMGIVFETQAQFGVKAGLNLTTLIYSGVPGSVDPAWKTSFNGGFLVLLPLASGFYIQPEVMYSGQGYEQTIDGNKSGMFELGYLNIPVLLKYQLESGLFAETGPQLGIILSGNADIDGQNYDIKQSFTTTDFSWALGLGYKFSSIGLGVDARYNFGLTNIMKDSQAGSLKNAVFQLGVFYLLGPKK